MSCNGSEKTHVFVGPYGGRCGVPWDDGIYSGVKTITITHGAAINSIQFEYDADGKSVLSEMHGSYGYKTDKIHFDLRDEYITFVSGHYGSLDKDGPIYVRSLAFRTNKRRYGPFGIGLEVPFRIPITGRSVVGFHGRSSFYLDAIGVHLKPGSIGVELRPPLLQLNSPRKGNERLTDSPTVKVDEFAEKEKAYSAMDVKKRFPNLMRNFAGQGDKVNILPNAGKTISSVDPFYPSSGTYGKAGIKDKVKTKLGPWGGIGGTPFDDGHHSAIYEIHVARSSAGVVSIRACYDISGRAVWGNTHGGNGGNRLDKIKFNYPHEHLTCVSGYYGPSTIGGPVVVKSITFYTNTTKYGPFGEEQGTHFSSDSQEGTVTGFHGTKGDLLESIGVYVM